MPLARRRMTKSRQLDRSKSLLDRKNGAHLDEVEATILGAGKAAAADIHRRDGPVLGALRSRDWSSAAGTRHRGGRMIAGRWVHGRRRRDSIHNRLAEPKRFD